MVEETVLPVAPSVVSITESEPVGINEINIINAMLEINKEIIGLIKQKSQYIAILNELGRIDKEINEGRLRTIYLPTVGNLLIPCNTHEPYILNILTKNREQFETAVKGIEGQIKHRRDIVNENIIRLQKFLTVYLKNNKLYDENLINYQLTPDAVEELPTIKKEQMKKKSGK